MFSYKLKRLGSSAVVLAVCFGFMVCSGQAFAAWENPASVEASDSVWAVWAQQHKKVSNIVCAKRDAGKWSSVETLSSTPYVNVAPSIALDDQMQPWVVWSSEINGSSDLLYRKRLEDGSWSKTQLVEASDALSDSTPALANLGNTQMGLVWAGFDGTDDEIYFAL